MENWPPTLGRGLASVTRVGSRTAAHPYSLRRANWSRYFWEADGNRGAAGAWGGAGDQRTRRVESILFLSREPLSSRKLCQYANLADATEARTLVRLLNESYDRSGRAFRAEEVAGGFQLLTRPQFARWLRRYGHLPEVARLSAPALETLAVVAHRQPIARSEIEAVRGVSCGEILRQLMDRDLIRIQGRSDELGRPYLYGTTRRFLQLFGLRSLDHLPRAAELRGGSGGQPKLDMLSQVAFPQEASAGLDRENEEESDVTATFQPVLPSDELLKNPFGVVAVQSPRCSDQDDDFEDEEDEDLDEDDEEDEDFEDEDFDDDEDLDDEDFEDEEDEEEDEDFEDEEWEEVEDEEEDEDEEWEEDDEDLDWEDEDEDEEEDTDEEEEEDWE